MKKHEKYMLRCLQLAENGMGTTRPNPLVGSVIVCKDNIIGEGWHRKAGGPHAEVFAIESVSDKSLLSRSTLYVNLEPCSHYGKTAPCADLIVASGIKKVVIGTVDSNSVVKGNGVKKLLEAGIDVTIGVLVAECEALNKRFFTFMLEKRPFVILKWAETADGFIAPSNKSDRKPVWISGSLSRQLVHKWRSEEHAILVGTNTVLDDNPSLTVREWTGNNPVRVVLDKSGKTSAEAAIIDNSADTIVITSNPIFAAPAHVKVELTEDFSVSSILTILYKNQITSVIVEGGAKTLQSFIDAEIWDEVRRFKGKSVFGSGIKAPFFNQTPSRIEQISDDTLEIYHK
ncbi:MAG: bifunctional diaminohydroxyphosphoribosylaminopyrimidine deaminase/5-amino-6-(5-phosphoribosylamino)uracil reductase RibD [Flavobacterium sp.]|nr:bifunctional diaminohydroxyphosphoribosylaminopyrimidine deaminase/5-amino-6-(5-phosphoribosylamino)uracil reductase RibD [Flavobacterium sp.]